MPTKAVSGDVSLEYAGHRIYFCCEECKEKYEQEPEAYTARANCQLAVTGQVSQVGCPISGGKIKSDQSSVVEGVTVQYCCGKCKAKMQNSTPTEQLDLTFGKRAFSKAFK